MFAILFRLLTMPLYVLLGYNSTGTVDDLPTLLLTEFDFKKDTARPGEVLLNLEARRHGIIAWVMSKLGILSRYYIRVTDQEVLIIYGSMRGSQYFVAPLSQVTTAGLALQKPAKLAYLGAALILIAIIGFFLVGPIALVGFIFGLVLMFIYTMKRNLQITFSTSNLDDRYGLRFVANRVTGKKVTPDDLDNAMKFVNQAILRAHQAI
jgi:hypothetical protein